MNDSQAGSGLYWIPIRIRFSNCRDGPPVVVFEFAIQAMMAASASAIFNKAKSRHFVQVSIPVDRPEHAQSGSNAGGFLSLLHQTRTAQFHFVQEFASIRFCASDFTSLNAAVYSALSRAVWEVAVTVSDCSASR